MNKTHIGVNGFFTNFLNETFYTIENYDEMENFFMSIASSSDIWNFCWSQGGITAGRVDSNNAVFPYYTADKVFDARSYTGSYSALHIFIGNKSFYWQPFNDAGKDSYSIQRNIYKNTSGTKIYFEEINFDLGMSYQYGWTSSDTYGLVRHVRLHNNETKQKEVTLLDGCQNIMSACTTSDFQNENSILLDAYKKTDIDTETNLSIFAVSSIVSDKAEPCEGLYANISWFSLNSTVYTNPNTPLYFKKKENIPFEKVLKGKRPSCFITQNTTLEAEQTIEWYQVFNTGLDSSDIALIQRELLNREKLTLELEQNIQQGIKKMQKYISLADGMQSTGNLMTSVHHRANVMFNIMRGGIFLNEYTIEKNDFLLFVLQKNANLTNKAAAVLKYIEEKTTYAKIRKIVEESKDMQLIRIFFDYMPLSFSRKHGDPSRPWNRFKIHIQDEKKNPILNYEGNWRDIFQNWEPLAYSFPLFLPNMISLFLDSMTADGYNPGALSRQRYHWEVPQENNPWANIGYWGDHQIIYLCKLLETALSFNDPVIKNLNSKRFSSTRVPYKLKNHKEMMANPRESIFFDRNLNTHIEELTTQIGMDGQLYIDDNDNPVLVSMTSKILQVCLTKLASLIPGGGIWLNTQRPEWNDANNALAGYGLSVVTLCYLYRYLTVLQTLFLQNSDSSFTVNPEVKKLFVKISLIYKEHDPEKTAASSSLRKSFIDSTGTAFEEQREVFYNKGLSQESEEISKKEILEGIEVFLRHCAHTITSNKRDDGLFNAYNTMKIGTDKIDIEYLPVMLEGQVAILSAGLLSPDESIEVCSALRNSDLFIHNQCSYILYPNKELPLFLEKNSFSQNEAETIPVLKNMICHDDRRIIRKDINNQCHFNPIFTNGRVLLSTLQNMKDIDSKSLTKNEVDEIAGLYERVFNHQSFTGRSGTFYAYEGLGSIYWHMVAKLMLAVQENMWRSYDSYLQNNDKLAFNSASALALFYYDVRKGIGYNKKPDEYGAFPFDPYSHTPYEQGAKQPGMTGQVKEEILTRMGELGLRVKDQCIEFNPIILEAGEFSEKKDLIFTWGSIPVSYIYNNQKSPTIVITHKVDGKIQTANISGNRLDSSWTQRIFSRDKMILTITVYIQVFGQLITTKNT